jgi:CheY-like chemotaxis protein
MTTPSKDSSINPKDFTLLIVDDEADLREVLAFSFQRAGFNTIEASNGTEAFEIFKKQKIDLIISDIQMPGGNGVELLDNIRKQHLEVPIVLFLTGFAEITVEEAYKKGAEALFAKPFDFKAVLKTVFLSLEPKGGRWQHRSWRGDLSFNVELKFNGFETARIGKVLNLSQGGLFVCADGVNPKVDDAIEFKIQFTEGTVLIIEGRGVVKWVRPGTNSEYPVGFGIEFIELSDKARGEIIELINFLKTTQHLPKL